MKKILNIFGIIGLISTGTLNLNSCNNFNNYENGKANKHKPEQQESPKGSNGKILYTIDKPLNIVDNKYYIVIGRNNKNGDGKINKFLNNREQFFINFNVRLQKSKVNGFYDLGVLRHQNTMIYGNEDNGIYFKSVYYGNGNNNPKIPKIDKNGTITNG